MLVRNVVPIHEPINAALQLTLLLVVTLCAVTDIAENRIPNIVLLPALLFALVGSTVLAGFTGFVESLMGLALGMAAFYPFYTTGGTSAGDVKLLGVVGAFVGVQTLFIVGAATLISGGVLGVLYISWRVIKAKLAVYTAQLVRFRGAMGPSILIPDTPDISRKTYIPYAPAIAFGTYYALWDLGYFAGMGLF